MNGFIYSNIQLPDRTFVAHNIDKAAHKLAILRMNAEDRRRYERYMESIVVERDVIGNAKLEGREEERYTIARNLLGLLPPEVIAEKTGLTLQEIVKLSASFIFTGISP